MQFADPIFGPIEFIVAASDICVLAIIIGTAGPSYRRVGAMMAISANGDTSGSLSSGCVEADIVNQALASIKSGKAQTVKYGVGSPVIDLQLPCGGGMEVILIPAPDRHLLGGILNGVEQRTPQTLLVNKHDGSLILVSERDAPDATGFVRVTLLPKTAFCIFGSGAETLHFASLAASLGFQISVCSPQSDLVTHLSGVGIPSRLLKSHTNLNLPPIDRWTAAILFFHDHDWEPPILKQLLDSNAFYIGAQGSQLARVARDNALAEWGVSREKINRICGPIGLIPATRDPRSLAISVLAQVMALVQEDSR